jgi:hypothetical protein
MTLIDFRSKNLTNRCYTCSCIRPVSGWQCVMVQLVELGRSNAQNAVSVSCFLAEMGAGYKDVYTVR